MNVWWLVARASGLIAWALVTASVLWGLALSTRILRQRPKPGWILDIHRYLGGLAVAYTAIHLGSLVADSYVHFDAVALFVPLASRWKPDAVAWGIAAFYLLAAIEMTSLAKRYVGRSVWRAVHATSFVLYVFATAHMLTAGTDAASPYVMWTAGASVIAVAGLGAYRRFARRTAVLTPNAAADTGR